MPWDSEYSVQSVEDLGSKYADQTRRVERALLRLNCAQESLAEAVRNLRQEEVRQESPGDDDSVVRGSVGHTLSSQSILTAEPGKNGERSVTRMLRIANSGSDSLLSVLNEDKSMQRPTLRKFRTSSRAEYETDRYSRASENAGVVAPMLPVHWPAVLEPQQMAKLSDNSLRSTASMENVTDNFRLHRRRTSETNSLDGSLEILWWHRCIRQPETRIDQMLNLMACIFLFYDLTFIPFVLAWDFSLAGPLLYAAWMSAVYWTLETALGFSTGFYSNGDIVMDARLAARRYVQGWFAVDFLVVSSDWLSLLTMFVVSSGDALPSLRVLRFAKLGKVFRLVGLVRVLRVVRTIELFLERNVAEMYRLGIRCFAICIGWLWVNHILACVWFAIGSYAPTDTGVRWLDTEHPQTTELKYAASDWSFQYATSFHWSIAQTTLGAMEIASVNTAERIFNVFCLLIGLFFGSSLISTLSAAMVEFRMSVQMKTGMMRLLRRYLIENHVEKKVALMIQRQVVARLDEQPLLTAADVKALDVIPKWARAMLHSQICTPYMVTHRMFQLWYYIDRSWFERFCSEAVTITGLICEDDLFLPGNEAKAAYFLISGHLRYTQLPESAPVKTQTVVDVDTGTWCSENALWTKWIHVGRMEARSRSQVLQILTEKLLEILQSHYAIRHIAVEYGRLYHERTVQALPPRTTWPSDIQVPFTDFGDLVAAFPADLQVAVGCVSLAAAKTWQWTWFSSGALNDLQREVQDGTSICILNQQGEIERVVSVVVLRIAKEDGSTLVQLAKWQDGRSVPDVQLPGVKCKRDETSDEAFDRLLATKLMPFQASVSVTAIDRELRRQQSSSLGISTVYMRKVYVAEYLGNLEDEGRSSAYYGSTSTKFPCMFDTIPIFFIPRQDDGLFCAWLGDEDLQKLMASSAGSPLMKRLSALRPAPESMTSSESPRRQAPVEPTHQRESRRIAIPIETGLATL